MKYAAIIFGVLKTKPILLTVKLIKLFSRPKLAEYFAFSTGCIDFFYCLCMYVASVQQRELKYCTKEKHFTVQRKTLAGENLANQVKNGVGKIKFGENYYDMHIMDTQQGQ